MRDSRVIVISLKGSSSVAVAIVLPFTVSVAPGALLKTSYMARGTPFE